MNPFHELVRIMTMKHRERFLYNLRTEGDHYQILKYNEEMEVISRYNVSKDGHLCDCPQNHRPTCRHRKMFSMVLDRVDTGWMFDYDDTGQWFDPFGTEEQQQTETKTGPVEQLPPVRGATLILEEPKPTGAFIPNRRRL